MAMVNSNLLLGLIAIAAVTTTLAGLIAVLWVTRRPRKLPDHTPPVTICKPLKGVDEGLEENLRSFFRLDYPTFQLLFCVAEADDPAIAVVNRLLAEFPDHDAQADRGLSDLRAQPEGREPRGHGPLPQARHHPDQRLERPRPPVLPPRDGLLPGRPERRAGHEPLRRGRRGADGGGPGEPPAQRVDRVGRRPGGGPAGRPASSASRC